MNISEGNDSQKGNTVRQNQINELIKIFEEDSLQKQLIELLSNTIEQEAYNLSGGYDTREYRTKLNTLKIRLKGTKGQYIRSVLSQQLMTPKELFSLDLSKLSEATINNFLEQNNRDIPTKQNLYSSAQKAIEVLKNSSQKKEENNSYQIATFSQNAQVIEQNNQFTSIIKNDQQAQEQSNQNYNKQSTKVNENDKIVFAPSEEPVQQFEEFIDYSFEYNRNQRDFIEGNDFPNIEELQLKGLQKNQQQIEQWGSPLPSDNVLNQEFLQDDQEQTKENVQTRILDSQIQLEEQIYYDHECSFQAQEIQNLDQLNQQDNQTQIEQIIQKNEKSDNLIEHQDPLAHTHNFENKIYEKVLRKHSLEVKPENQDKTDQQDSLQESQRYKFPNTITTQDQFFQILQQMEEFNQKRIEKLNQQTNQLEEELLRISEVQALEIETFKIQKLNQQCLINSLKNENNLLEKILLDNQKNSQQQIKQLQELQQREKQQFEKYQVTISQRNNTNHQIIQQISFNSNLRNDQIKNIKKQKQIEMNLEDNINTAQALFFNHQKEQPQQQEKNELQFSSNQESLENQNYQNSNNIIKTDLDTQIKQIIINADSGSTQIKKNQFKLQEQQEFDINQQSQNDQVDEQFQQFDNRQQQTQNQNKLTQIQKSQQNNIQQNQFEEEKHQQKNENDRIKAQKKPQKRKNIQTQQQFDQF